MQDLNPLQIALVELLATDPADTVMLLGDEQQAIFSFMGAKLSTLEQLKERCRGRVHHLDVNHRSRRYLLNVFNTYAEEVLHIDPDLLPKADNDQQAAAGDLTMLQSCCLRHRPLTRQPWWCLQTAMPTTWQQR